MSLNVTRSSVNELTLSDREAIFGSINQLSFPVLPVAFTLTSSFITTLMVIYFLQPSLGAGGRESSGSERKFHRSTPLPGWGILGDRINEFIGIFLDALAIYVHNDKEFDCPRRFLCEANQRAVDNGPTHGVLMYLASLFVSFWLRDQRVSASITAMKRGRHGDNCVNSYPCPISL